jgi:peptidyl-prolyl cis-trans isomerase B (cyclophilin B)
MKTLLCTFLILGMTGIATAAEKEGQVIEDKAIQSIDGFIASSAIDTSKPGWKTTLPMPKAADFESTHEYYWHMKTNKGDILIQLLPEVAPMHVTSTIYLTHLGFYDGLTFHRVIPGFMAQGGCPLGSGTGGPGYKYAGEYSPSVKHNKPGLLSMANAGPNTDGSQFFLTFVPTPHLDGKHSIFGEVLEGTATLKAMEAVGSRTGATSEPVLIEKATIEVRARD